MCRVYLTLPANSTENTAIALNRTKDECDAVLILLSELFKSMGIFLERFVDNARGIMKSHAPAYVRNQIETIVKQKLIFTITGYMGALGLKSNILEMPKKMKRQL